MSVLNRAECPKCGLKAETLLHRFCTHAPCPIRDALNARIPSGHDNDCAWHCDQNENECTCGKAKLSGDA